MNKRGMNSHVEMMLASIIFILFFFFVITFLEPYKTNILTTTINDGIFYNFKNLVSIDVRKFFLSFNDTVFSECFCVPLDINGDYGSIVTDINGNVITSNVNTDKLNIYSNNPYYYIYFSENFSKSIPTTCSETTQYNIGGILDSEFFFYDKLKELETKYYSNYEEVKKNLGIPPQFNFNIESNIVSMKTNIPSDIPVIAKEYRESIIYNNGTIINTIFLIRVW